MGASASHSGHRATDSASPAAYSGAAVEQTDGAQGEQPAANHYIVNTHRQAHHFADVVEMIKKHPALLVISHPGDIDGCVASHALVDGVRRANKIQQNSHVVGYGELGVAFPVYAVLGAPVTNSDTLIVAFGTRARLNEHMETHSANPSICICAEGGSHSTFVRVLANSYTQTKKIDVVQTEWAMWNRVWGYLLAPTFDHARLYPAIGRGEADNELCRKLDELPRYHDCIDYADFDIVHATELHEAAKSYMACVVDQEHIDRVGHVVTGIDGVKVGDVGTTHGRYLNRVGLAEQLRVIQHKHNGNHVVYASFAGATKWMDTTAVSIRWCKAICDQIAETVEAQLTRPSHHRTIASTTGIVVVCIWDGDDFDNDDGSAKTGSFTDAIWKTMGRLMLKRKVAAFEMVSSSFANTEHGDAKTPGKTTRNGTNLPDTSDVFYCYSAIGMVHDMCAELDKLATTESNDANGHVKATDLANEIRGRINPIAINGFVDKDSMDKCLTDIENMLRIQRSHSFADTVKAHMFGNNDIPDTPDTPVTWHPVTDEPNGGRNGGIGRSAFCAMLESPACAVLKASCSQLFGPTCFEWQCPTDSEARLVYIEEHKKAVNSDEFDWDSCKCPDFNKQSQINKSAYPKLGTMAQQRTWRTTYTELIEVASADSKFWTKCGHATSIHEATDWQQRCCTLFGYLCLGAYNRAVQSTHVQRSRKLLHGVVITDVGRLFSQIKGDVAVETAEYMKNSTTWLSRKGQFEYLPPFERIQSLVLKLPARTTCLEMMAKELFDEDVANRADLLGERMLSEALDRSDEKRNQDIVNGLVGAGHIGASIDPHTIILMRGVQGSGKSTLVNAIQQIHGKDRTVVCSADDFFTTAEEYVYDDDKIGTAHEECKKAMIAAMIAQKSLIIVDNTHANIADIAIYTNRVDEASEYQIPKDGSAYKIVLLELEIPPVAINHDSILRRQILADAYARRNKHGVTFTGILSGMNHIDVTNNIRPEDLSILLSNNTSPDVHRHRTDQPANKSRLQRQYAEVPLETVVSQVQTLLHGRIRNELSREVVNQLYDMKELATSRMETTMQRLLH